MVKGTISVVALVAAATALARFVAACTTATPTATTTTAGGGGESDPATTEQTSALLAQPIHDAQVVLGGDGKDHVEYELMVVNVFFDPVTLTSVTFLDPGGKGSRGSAPRSPPEPGRSSREHQHPRSTRRAAVAVDVDLALEPGAVPERVTQRIEYTLPDPQRALIVDIGETVVHGPEVAIDRRAPIVLAPPVAGDGWLVSSSCCAPNVHRDLRLAINGARIETPETFAIDWARVENERIYDGDGAQNEQHYAFGGGILAVANATVVVVVVDGEPEQLPNVKLVPSDSEQARVNSTGNLVVLELEPNVFVVYPPSRAASGCRSATK